MCTCRIGRCGLSTVALCLTLAVNAQIPPAQADPGNSNRKDAVASSLDSTRDDSASRAPRIAILDTATGVRDTAESTSPLGSSDAKVYSLDLPDLIGFYGGFAGMTHESYFDFGDELFTIYGALLHLRGTVRDDLPAYTFLECDLKLDNQWAGAASTFTRPDHTFEVIIPLLPSESMLDGTGHLLLWIINYACCDRGASVESAELSMEAVPMFASLAGFAEFQACFSGEIASPPAGCDHFDYDGDTDVDLTDYHMLRDLAVGP